MNAPIEHGLAAALATLGLRPDADARAVRRAYAQQVKQIDQATELQAFQALREAYEQALGGVARRDAQAAAAAPAVDSTEPAETATPEEPPLATAPPLHDSTELAQAVFQPFATRAAAGFKDEPDAADALQQALADDRLLNLEARTLFEWQVAQLIMKGWQPGHEFLFAPACTAFDWEKDRAHLRIFGQLGAVLDAAIGEKLMFFQQSSGSFELQRSAIRRLRQTEMPSVALRRADLPLVQMLVQRYPNWLRLVTSQANINTWFQELPEPEPTATTVPTATALSPVERPKRTLPWLGWIFALLLVIGGISRTGQHQPPAGASPPPWARVTPTTQPAMPPWSDSALGAEKDSPFGPGTTAPAPLYRDLPPPVKEPAPEPVPAGAQFAFLGNVTFIRAGDKITVDDVDTGSGRGRSTLQPGDRVQRCPPIEKWMPFFVVLERSGCDNVKSVDERTGIVTYVFHVLRRGKTTTAALVMPPPQGQARTAANAAAVEEALKAAATLPMSPPERPPAARPSTEATVQLGHVTFGRQDSAVVVTQVGERNSRSFGTLQPGDMVLGCMSGDYHLPLVRPAEVRNCVTNINLKPEPGVTAYMFRVLRDGKSIPASLSLRDEPAAPASSPAPTSTLQFSAPGSPG